jgi:UTP--glucose-1-phosphate uridylyltransferase
MPPIRKAVMPVAGLGTRFLPVTKAIPKEMLPILSKPLVQYAVEEAFAAGIDQILFVNGRGKSAIEDFFDRAPELEERLRETGKSELLARVTDTVPAGGQFAFVRQTQALGFGHAVLCAKHWVQNEPFAILLPDDLIMSASPCIKQLVDHYDLSLGNMAAVVDVKKEQVSAYGVLDVATQQGSLLKAKGVVEKPHPDEAPSTKAIIGRYILHPDVFSVLATQKPGVGGEIQLTDALERMIPTHGLTGLVIEGHRFDCGSVEGMVEAQVAYGLKDPHVGQKIREAISRWVV